MSILESVRTSHKSGKEIGASACVERGMRVIIPPLSEVYPGDYIGMAGDSRVYLQTNGSESWETFLFTFGPGRTNA